MKQNQDHLITIEFKARIIGLPWSKEKHILAVLSNFSYCSLMALKVFYSIIYLSKNFKSLDNKLQRNYIDNANQ